MGFIIFGIPTLILILIVLVIMTEISESKTISIMEVFWNKKIKVELKEKVKRFSTIPEFFFDDNIKSRVSPENLFYFRYGGKSDNYVIISMSKNSIVADINDLVLVMYNRNLYIREVVSKVGSDKVEVVSPFDSNVREVIGRSDMKFCIEHIFVGGKRLL